MSLSPFGPCASRSALFTGFSLASGADSVKKGGGRFVVAPVAAGEFGFGRNEFAAEGLGQDRLGDFVRAFRRGFDSFLYRVSELEEGFDTPDDFVLFI